MKFTKRILAILLAMLMAIGMFSIAASASMDPVGDHYITNIDVFRYSMLTESKTELLPDYFWADGPPEFELFFEFDSYNNANFTYADYQRVDWNRVHLKCAGFEGYEGDLTTTAAALAAAQSLMRDWNRYLAFYCTPAQLTKYRENRQYFVDFVNAEYALWKYWLQTEPNLVGQQYLQGIRLPDRSNNDSMKVALQEVTADIHAYLQAEGVANTIPTDDPTEPFESQTVYGPPYGNVTVTYNSDTFYPSAAPNLLVGPISNTQITGFMPIASFDISFAGIPSGAYPLNNTTFTVRLPIPASYTGDPALLTVYHNQTQITITNRSSTWIEFETTHFSIYSICAPAGDTEEPGESQDPADPPEQKWWEKLSSWLQGVLRYILFGWLWMK